MLPFIGYNAGDYFAHWIKIGQGQTRRKLPRDLLRQLVPPRRPTAASLWPGFGENIRVLKWAIERIEGTADAKETPIGFIPTGESIDLTGLDMTPEQVEEAVKVDPAEWKEELKGIEEWYARFGDALPDELAAELKQLQARFA